jgi:hypothetical protein
MNRLIGIAILSLALIAQEAPQPGSEADKHKIVITDLQQWHQKKILHILAKNHFKANRVELFNDKSYFIIHATMPFEPREGFHNAKVLNRMEAEIFVENKERPFAIQDDDRGLRLEVHVIDKKTNAIEAGVYEVQGK